MICALIHPVYEGAHVYEGVYNPTHQYDPLQAHMNTNTVRKGACLLPFDNLQVISVSVDHTNVRNYHFTFVLKNF